MNIVVVGAGYVGLANAVMLAQHNNVTIVDTNPERIKQLNNRQSPIKDVDISHYLANKPIQLQATQSTPSACHQAELVIIATPTNYDPTTNHFDTTSIEQVIQQVRQSNPHVAILIKSTVPVGYTQQLSQQLNDHNILFSPEFLREGKALHDTLYPSRIVVGEDSKRGSHIANLMQQGTIKQDAPVLLTNATEAEAIKLFANTYLAMRISFFNELDSYAASFELNTKQIIDGIGLDPRIGSHYNNPSFGYGGYCLPKDTKQLLANYGQVPNNLIRAIVEANQTRKQFVVNAIMKKRPKTVGIYRLVVKTGSDNYRSSAILDIIQSLKEAGLQLYIFEPTLSAETFEDVSVIEDLLTFKSQCDLILANRTAEELKDVSHKTYTRDIFGDD